MPWKESCVMDQKIRLIGDWLSEEYTVTELSAIYQVSRNTVYKWVERYQERGLDGLNDLSSAPINHPNETRSEIIEKIIQMKLANQKRGPKKIIAKLQGYWPDETWPAISTTGEILKRQGLVKPRKRKRRVQPYSEPFIGCDEPNKVWSADYKGQFKTGDGKLCYPLTITDNYSRYLLQCRGLSHPSHEQTQPWFEWTFREYGLPEAIKTDNGTPFASVGLGGLSRLSVWLIKLGIRPERIEPGHPEQNGRHERMHLTLKEATMDPPKRNMAKQQEAFEEFNYDLNYERPHEAIGQKVPGSIYYPSDRAYPKRIPEIEYDGDVIVKKVRHSGELYWKGKFIHVSQALAREPISLKQIDEHLWEISFSFYSLGILNEQKGKVIPHKSKSRRQSKLKRK
ncbi:MAG: transposase [Deltaproteobacteria bacterium]|nr:transposase [Deltaproteobacteria bacterium]